MDKRKRKKGILTIEASIVLTLMTLFILFLFSFIRVYRAENVVSHATLQAADSIALESYLRERALNGKADDVVFMANRLTGETTLSQASFESLRSANLQTLAKDKFTAAIADSEANADSVLKKYGVKEGLNGVSFASSTADLINDDIIVSVNYTVEMQFPIFGGTEIALTKTAKAKTFGEILFDITAESENPKMGSTSGSGSYKKDTEVEITANPYNGYKFVRWDDGSTDITRKIPANETKNFVAIFEPDGYGITTNAVPSSAGSATGGGTYQQGEVAHIKAKANSGYHFDKWSVFKHEDDATEYNTAESVDQTVDQSYTYTANFEPNDYIIKVESNTKGATVVAKSGAEAGQEIDVTYGSRFDLVQEPPEGYLFKGWKMEGASSYMTSTNAISVPSKYPDGKEIPNNSTITYTAYYEIIKCKVKVTSAGNGTVTGDGTYNWGTTVTINAKPKAQYLFDYWKLNGTKSSTPVQYKFVVKSDVNYEAHFKPCPHTNCTITEHIFYCRAVNGGGSPRCSKCNRDCRPKGVKNSYKLSHCNICGRDAVVGQSPRWNKHYVFYRVKDAGLPNGFVYDGVNDDFNTACRGHSTGHYGTCNTNPNSPGSNYHYWGTYYHIICDYCHAVEQPKQVWWNRIMYVYCCGYNKNGEKHQAYSKGPASDSDCSGFSVLG